MLTNASAPIKTIVWRQNFPFVPPITLRFSLTMASNEEGSINTKTRKRKPTQTEQKPLTVTKSKEAIVIQDIEDFGNDETLKIRASLLNWYDRNKRDLPWRRIVDKEEEEEEEEEEDDESDGNRKAYAVWVSEVMLQQTQVSTVVDYYNRWMKKWPSIQHLAQASLEEVNEMWAGLGYYRRGRFLLEGAKMIAEEGGSFPRGVEDIRKVRGIGDYTAGAIASIAFKEAVPVVDGNVVRVISRLKALSSNPKGTSAVKNLWRLAAQLVDPSRPGDFNQALMELGATICSPWNPTCSICPVLSQCRAFSEAKQCDSVKVTDYPMKVVKAKPRQESTAICVVEIFEDGGISDKVKLSQNGSFLLIKRPDAGLLAGLWEFPSVLLNEDSDVKTRQKVIDQFLKPFSLEPLKTYSVVSRQDVGELVHVFSHIRLKMYVELLIVRLKDGVDILSKNQVNETIVWKCVNSKLLSSMGLTSGVRKVYRMIQKFKESQIPSVPAQAKRKRTKVSKT